MTIKPKTKEIFDYLKLNGKTSMDKLVEVTGRAPRSISGSITALHNMKDEDGNSFAEREKDGDVTYVYLTDAGLAFIPDEE